MDTSRMREAQEASAAGRAVPRDETTAPPATGPHLAGVVATLPGPRTPRGRFAGTTGRLALTAKIIASAAAAFLILVTALLALYRFIDPPFTTLTASRWLMREPVDQRWVPLGRMSPLLLRAVVASEDARFCQHWGVDFGELKAALADWRNGAARGASTISMQVIKNLFLWPQRSLVRKAIEIPLTLVMELLWPKWRILEVYLNTAEWGQGVFGAEAAARHHFQKSAARLSADESAQLAVSLPNPVARDAGDPGPRVQRLAERIEDRMRDTNLACIGLGRR